MARDVAVHTVILLRQPAGRRSRRTARASGACAACLLWGALRRCSVCWQAGRERSAMHAHACSVVLVWVIPAPQLAQGGVPGCAPVYVIAGRERASHARVWLCVRARADPYWLLLW
jgi:hypothetical protein